MNGTELRTPLLGDDHSVLQPEGRNPLTRFWQRIWRPAPEIADLPADERQAAYRKLAGRPASGRWCPEEDSGLVSQLLYNYVSGIVRLGYAKALEVDDVWDLAHKDECDLVSATFSARLAATATPEHPQGVLSRGLVATHGRMFWAAGALKLIHDGIMFLGPVILEFFLRSLQEGNSRLKGFGWSVALLASATVQTITVNLYFSLLFRISLQLKAQLIDAVYRKSLRLSAAARGEMGVGEVLNLQSNDVGKLWKLPQYLHLIWSGPFQILAVMLLLVRVVGVYAALAGLGVTILLVPLSTAVGMRMSAIRKRLMGYTDARIKLVTEVIFGIKAIKLYAWEEPYMQRINELRDRELQQLRNVAVCNVFGNLGWFGGPVFVSIASLGVYAGTGGELTAAVAFPALALFNLLRFPVMVFPEQITNIINARVATRRLQKFLDAEEKEPAPPLPAAEPGQLAIEVKDGRFGWTATGPALLRSIDLAVEKGRLVMVVGPVGCGKSSLLQALLGEMYAQAGSTTLRGSIGYTSQDPWIQNASLRDNILLGAPFRPDWYDRVVETCALLPDIAMLPNGDATEIGEKGVNLSGGQRQRVALARACYADADVYLLDDPLSAVDAHVGRHLFDRCICGLLGQRTRILVTHQLQHLPGADLVVVLQDGEVAQRGSYEQLLAAGVNFHQLKLQQDKKTNGSASDGSSPAPSESDDGEGSDSDGESRALLGAREALATAGAAAAAHGATEYAELGAAVNGDGDRAAKSGKGKAVAVNVPGVNGKDFAQKQKVAAMTAEERGTIVKVEERAVGRVQRSIYLAYLRAWGPHFLLPIVVLSWAVFDDALLRLQSFWLSLWTNAVDRSAAAGGSASTDTAYYLVIYFLLGIVSVVFQISRSFLEVWGSTNASRHLHKNLLAKVVRLPMAFFESQPTGRLLNRFTKDTESVDSDVAQSFSYFVTATVAAGGAVIVVALVTPAVLIAAVPMALVYRRVQKMYIASSRELKRLDSLAFSPIFGTFNETLVGMTTLRAFRRQPMFLARNSAVLDASNRMYWPGQMLNRWLSVRLEMLGTSIVFGAALLTGCLLPASAGLAGLALTSALDLTGLLDWLVREMTELEVNMNGVERMVEYSALAPEAPAVLADSRPPAKWPAEGAISVEGLWLRYRPELDPVLKGLTFTIHGREKVGVAGRTGCGKSTLMMTLYRIVEPCGGTIRIDGVDILRIGLRDLRSRLALVPQDPVIFSGSVRENLDPFGLEGGDAEIWEALQQAGMAPAIKALEGGLDAVISEGGGNLSVGQRQLLCMARALLRKSRILVLDEATSNVDHATDELIQRTIRTAFEGCTVLTIAHRLNTIIDSDRVMVLDAGNLLEFDTPHRLLKDPSTAFAGLVAEMNKKTVSK